MIANTQSWLYMPWRESYSKLQTNNIETKQCPFCAITKNDNDKKLILYRTESFYIKLNAFPYSQGHLLIMPIAHVQSLQELTAAERIELIELINTACQKVNVAFGCEGINFGANIGNHAGASIPDHLHIHVVPRYANEKSFMETTGDTNLIPWNLQEMYAMLKPYFVS